MDVADMLIDKMLSWVNLQKKCAEKMNELATELEAHKKNVNISQVAGSVGSVAGAAAMTAAGVATIFTGGVAIPVIGVAGAIVSLAGFATNTGSELVNFIISSRTMKEAKDLEEKIENLENGIQKLMETLKNEGERREKEAGSCSDGPPEDYVTEKILRAMAKRNGLELHKDISLLDIISVSRCEVSGKDQALRILKKSIVGLGLLSKFVIQAAAKKSGKALMSKLLPELVATMGPKAAAKALGRVGGGAVGLLVGVPELISNCVNLDKCETEASESLRKNAKAIHSTSEELKKELDEIQKAFKRLADVIASLQKTKRSSSEKQILFDFAMENCQDETVRQWIEENSESETFFKLVDMFHFLKEKIDEEEKENHSNNVHITFLAHGAIRYPMIPACCLHPLPTITDVVLHSPWNCLMTADAAYGVATGKMKPHDRIFFRREDSKVPNEKPQPTNLPNDWNYLKKAGGEMIPNIIVSPLQPEDSAWARYKALSTIFGEPGRNWIIIQYQLNEKTISYSSDVIPFSVVTLALSLVLLFSRFTATVHLIACLGDTSAGQDLDKTYLKKQYACTADNTVMTYSLDMFKLLIFKPLLG